MFTLMWFQIRTMWLLIWWLLETYMVANFRVHEINQGTSNLVRTPTLKKKSK